MTKSLGGDKVIKSDEAWRAQLTPEQYEVTRRHGTERAFSGPHRDNTSPGIYSCVCCGDALFDAATKYESGTGWPSFYAALASGAVREHEDRSLFMRRIEARCGRCDAHLGHVFSDGPRPTGSRYCMNGLALDFTPAKQAPE